MQYYVENNQVTLRDEAFPPMAGVKEQQMAVEASIDIAIEVAAMADPTQITRICSLIDEHLLGGAISGAVSKAISGAFGLDKKMEKKLDRAATKEWTKALNEMKRGMEGAVTIADYEVIQVIGYVYGEAIRRTENGKLSAYSRNVIEPAIREWIIKEVPTLDNESIKTVGEWISSPDRLLGHRNSGVFWHGLSEFKILPKNPTVRDLVEATDMFDKGKGMWYTSKDFILKEYGHMSLADAIKKNNDDRFGTPEEKALAAEKRKQEEEDRKAQLGQRGKRGFVDLRKTSRQGSSGVSSQILQKGISSSMSKMRQRNFARSALKQLKNVNPSNNLRGKGALDVFRKVATATLQKRQATAKQAPATMFSNNSQPAQFFNTPESKFQTNPNQVIPNQIVQQQEATDNAVGILSIGGLALLALL